MDPIWLLLPLFAVVSLGCGAGAVWYGARLERQRITVQVPKDLADQVAAISRQFMALRDDITADLDQHRRGYASFLEDASGILESVERKRAQAAGRKSRERHLEPVETTPNQDPELMREGILARARTQGFDD